MLSNMVLHLSWIGALLRPTAMSSRPLLLHFGNDALLAEARVLVLEDAGYDVVSAETQSGALRLLRARPVSLVIACHTVPPGELEATVRQMKQLKPRVPVIVVHVGGVLEPQRSVADGFVDGLRGPAHLLAQVASFSRRNRIAVAS
jgi:DNA-binding response OmpR family regulator